MKKIFWCIVFSLISIFVFTSKGEHCFATEDNEISVKTKYLTGTIVSNYNNYLTSKGITTMLADGDYAISVYITNNTGFAATGFRVEYNDELVAPLLYTKNGYTHPVNIKGEAAGELVLNSSYSLTNHYLTFATMGANPSENDGNIITYFVRPLQGFDIDEDENDIVVGYVPERWLDEDADPVVIEVLHTVTVHHYVETFYCIYGDINNDGYITVEDAQILDEICTDYAPIDIEDYTIVYEYGTLHNTVNGNYLIAVGDVDQDGDIDEDDAFEILDYYTQYIVYNQTGYTGVIGTTAYYYVEYTVQL